MKKRRPYNGMCSNCKKTISKVGAVRHIRSCKDAEGLLLYVGALHMPEYWLYLDVPHHATLEDIDHFLRNMWLECCGHLSAFRIRGESYAGNPDPEFDDSGMDVALVKAVDIGEKFEYEYDFGSTTHLTLKLISKGNKKRKKGKITVLARNVMPEDACTKCGKKAAVICNECQWEDEPGIFCKTCVAKHGHEEDMSLPLVNSPRAGVCGYAG